MADPVVDAAADVAVYTFVVERYDAGIPGWEIIGDEVTAQYERVALENVLRETPKPQAGRYRVIRSDVSWRGVTEFDVRERREWDIDRIEWPRDDD